MDAKTLKVKAIDTAYRQMEPTTRKEFGKRINLVHVDENMYAAEKDPFNDHVTPQHEEHKSRESGEQNADAFHHRALRARSTLVIEASDQKKAKAIAVG